MGKERKGAAAAIAPPWPFDVPVWPIPEAPKHLAFTQALFRKMRDGQWGKEVVEFIVTIACAAFHAGAHYGRMVTVAEQDTGP